MAAAIREVFGTTTQFGVGPAIENGFYYDVMLADGKTISEDDLSKIEKKMRNIIKMKCDLVMSEKTRAEALIWAKEHNQRFKMELIEELPEEERITFCSIVTPKISKPKLDDGGKWAGETMVKETIFEDLCTGPHVANTGEVGPFKLMKVAGAYWRGDEKREMMQRVYGVAFENEEDLAAHLKMLDEAKERDHRKVGKELDLFCLSQQVGSGLPLFTPRGTILRDKLSELSQKVRQRVGYQKITTPHIANVELYKISGHYEKFPELLKFVSEESGDELALKPVSCPHHVGIYLSNPRSYKDLPMKYLETTMVYRDERKGELGGLSRVRAITQDDSHTLCTDSQVSDVFRELVEGAKEIYALLDMK